MVELRLPLPEYPYRFDLLLDIVKRNAFPARMVVREGKLWRYTCGQLISYRQAGAAIVVEGSPLTNEARERIDSESRRLLGIDNDLSAFFASAHADDKLWHIIEPVVGLPIFVTETVFEALATLVIEQHITWENALQSQRTLMQICDARAAAKDHVVYDFPGPDLLAACSREQLKPLKITNRRIDLLLQIARDQYSGDQDLEQIRHWEASAAYDELLKIKGVGHWTAANTIGRAMGCYPYVSHNDVALQSAVNHYFWAGLGEKSAQQVLDTLKDFGEYAGLVGHFVLLRWVLDQYPEAPSA